MPDLLLIARECRERIERASGQSSHITFQHFPHGACGDTSDLIARLLVERYELPARYVFGLKDGHRSHAWVAIGSTIIDITADQFEDGMPSVFVGDGGEWHAAWRLKEERSHHMPAGWPMYPFEIWQELIR